jgi:hypothetical protein
MDARSLSPQKTMKRIAAALLALVAGSACATSTGLGAGVAHPETRPAAEGGSEPGTEEEKTLYATGLAVSRELSALSLSPAELELVKRGFSDAASPARSHRWSWRTTS